MSFYKHSSLLKNQCLFLYVNYIRPTGCRNISRWVAPTLRELQRRRDKVGPEPERPRSSYLEWNYNAELFAFGKRLGEELDRSILKRALVQKEYANLAEFKAQNEGVAVEKLEHNDELIQEGEKIINNYLKKELSKTYPDDITKALIVYLTTEEMLSHIGVHIGLKDIILSEEFPVSKNTLSNTFKAVVAALKRSQDVARAENFVKDLVLTQLNGKDVYEIWDPKEPYEYLTKLLKERGITAIEPRLCNESASNTILACFQVGLYSNKKLLGLGWGENIKTAKETAALNAIQRLYSQNNANKN
ncbi:39S ribosomal protein L44, mitochondrial [Diabrotica virgifera virgifera]|uniref:Large ribosomal subunit protein mL44 n=1 Tax=Diabrotica virgifera virgifera TaxID=50390 RepID=A0A6P7FZ76_DIAVI|nr:39S ribosomal protein L44, mitochondrial [Diabrotica virgifera virgifera]